ncbi:histidinol-phosphate aminotransferase family protein [Helicobacter muridarum]|uniref:Aminotransferase n=1 Tax=Helicobacter muridarum TaxID=216 RepID=A0A377PUH1_9HELI|nr:histidinol-phosphate transaminase [Helicobacter muridarum]TLE01612.1 histidinol-phosphate aminotransferase family protein [Helicobacter muridarum]STQ86227.1 histidinol-phosphate aminotransferase [Helicobacter muridarum]
MENVQDSINRRDILKIGTLIGGVVALGGALSPMNAATSQSKPTKNNPLMLNYNENAYGCSQLAKKAIENNINNISLYPEKLTDKLLNDIADFHQIKTDKLCLTNGASAGIQSSIYTANRMAQEQGLPLRIIIPNPTFEFVEEYAKPLDIEIVKYNLDADFEIDIDGMKKNEREFDGMSLVYLCNPNNPTSNIINANDLHSWIRTAKNTTVFLIDEAYAEYVVSNMFTSGIDILKGGAKNVIVVRSLSKIFGLAGLRVGYIITTPELKRRIDEFLEIVGINALGAVAASAAIKDFGFRQYCLNSNIKSRQIVTKVLDSLNLRYAPSHGNFIFHEINGQFDDFANNMELQNIIVGRKFDRYENFCRVTLGTPDQMQYYTKVLKDFRKKRLV